MLPSIGHSFRSCSSGEIIQMTRSLVALERWSLTRVYSQCVYHPLHEMWSKMGGGGWLLMRGVINEGFYCSTIYGT